MKLKVNRDKFAKAIAKVAGIANPKTTLAVLSNVLLEAENNILRLTATNLEIRITTEIEATVESIGKTTIRAKFLSLIINGLTSQEVSMESDDNHHTKIQCGSSKYTVNGIGIEEFPACMEFESLQSFEINESEFGKIIEQISYSVGVDDHRKVLHGIYLAVEDNKLISVATDGKRLALVEKEVESCVGSNESVIVPLRSADEIKRLVNNGKDAKKAKIETSAAQLKITIGSTVMTTKLIEGKFPDYKRIIPNALNITVDIPVPEFLAKAELAAAAIAESGQFMKLTFEDNKVTIEGSGKDIYDGMDTVAVEYKDSPLSMALNPQYLIEPFIHCMEDKLTMNFKDGTSPATVKTAGGFLYVLMPMRNK